MEMNQKSDAAILNAAASQSIANILVPRWVTMLYSFKEPFKAAVRVEKMIVDARAERIVNKVAKPETIVVMQLPTLEQIAKRPATIVPTVVQNAIVYAMCMK